MKNILFIILTLSISANLFGQKVFEEKISNMVVYDKIVNDAIYITGEMNSFPVIYKLDKTHKIKNKYMFKNVKYKSATIVDISYLNGKIFVLFQGVIKLFKVEEIAVCLNVDLEESDRELLVKNESNIALFKEYLANQSSDFISTLGGFYGKTNPTQYDRSPAAFSTIKEKSWSYEKWGISNYVIELIKQKGDMHEFFTMKQKGKDKNDLELIATSQPTSYSSDYLILKSERINDLLFISLSAKSPINKYKISGANGPNCSYNDEIAIVSTKDKKINLFKIELSSKDFSPANATITYHAETNTAYISGAYFDNNSYYDRGATYKCVSGNYLTAINLNNNEVKTIDHPFDKSITSLIEKPIAIRTYNAHGLNSKTIRTSLIDGKINVLYRLNYVPIIANAAMPSNTDADYISGYLVEVFDNKLNYLSSVFTSFKNSEKNIFTTIDYHDYKRNCKKSIKGNMTGDEIPFCDYYNYPFDTSPINETNVIGFLEASNDFSTIVYAYDNQIISCKNGTEYSLIKYSDNPKDELINAKAVKLSNDDFLLAYRNKEMIKGIKIKL